MSYIRKFVRKKDRPSANWPVSYIMNFFTDYLLKFLTE